MRRERLAAETAGKRLKFKVTEEFPAGRCRVVNEVYLNLTPGAKPRKRLAEFRVRWPLDGPSSQGDSLLGDALGVSHNVCWGGLYSFGQPA